MRRYNVEMLENKSTLRHYDSTAEEIFEEKQIKYTNDVNEIWNKVKDTIEHLVRNRDGWRVSCETGWS